MHKSFSFIICFLLSSCFPLTGNGLKDINFQDSKENVIEKIGKPYSKKLFYNKEYMVYYVHDGVFDLFFSSTEIPYIGFYPFLRTGKEYWIILEDNKVVAVGLAKNFKSNIPKALSTKGVVLEATDL